MCSALWWVVNTVVNCYGVECEVMFDVVRSDISQCCLSSSFLDTWIRHTEQYLWFSLHGSWFCAPCSQSQVKARGATDCKYQNRKCDFIFQVNDFCHFAKRALLNKWLIKAFHHWQRFSIDLWFFLVNNVNLNLESLKIQIQSNLKITFLPFRGKRGIP